MKKQREIKALHFTLPLDHIEDLRSQVHCPLSQQILAVVLEETSGVGQLAHIHQLRRTLALLQPQDRPVPSLILQSLTRLFLQIDEKSLHARKLFEKILLEDISAQHSGDLVAILAEQFQQGFLDLPPSTLENVHRLTQQILPCFSSFPLGLQALVPSIPAVLEFCRESVDLINQLLKAGSIESQLPSICQQLLRLVFKLLLSGLTDWQPHRPALATLAAPIQGLLSQEHLWLNCRLNACIALCSILIILKDRALLIEKLKECPEAVVLTEGEMSPLSLCTQISFSAGWMTVLQAEDSCCGLVVHTFLPQLLEASRSSRPEEVPTLVLARTMEQALSLLVSKLPLSPNIGLKLSSLLPDIFDFVWIHWEHQVEGIGCHLQASFKSGFHLLQNTSEDSEESFSWLVRVVHALPRYKGCRYRALSSLVSQCGAAALLAQWPQLPLDLLDMVADPSIAGHVADTFLQIISSLSSDKISVCLQPLLHTLLSTSSQHRTAIYENVLPKLFKHHPTSSDLLLRHLLALKDNQTTVPVVVHCLRRWFAAANYNNHNTTFGGELDSVVNQALKHLDGQVRLDGLALLCLSRPLPSTLSILGRVLPSQLDCPSPAHRQDLLAILNKFIQRLKEAGISLCKKLKTSDNDATLTASAKAYQEFLDGFHKLLFTFLQPTANFGHRYLALQLLALLQGAFGTTGASANNGLSYSKPQVQQLVECLKDPYEENKQAALSLLINISHFPGGVEYLQRLYLQGLEMVRSSRPTWAMTAAYILALVASRPAGSRLSIGCYGILEALVAELSHQLTAAEFSLLEAATNAPLYGVLTCLRFVFTLELKDRQKDQWQELVWKVFALCQRTVVVVGPVVCSDSPEGFLPLGTQPEQLQELISKAGLGRGPMAPLDPVKTQAVTAQLLLLCAWRSHKEVSLLLGTLASCVLLCPAKVVELGSFLITQLMVVQHKGAIEHAYLGLAQVCQALWRLSPQEASHQVARWLEEMMDLIRTARVSPTRRGAGVPYVVQALLESEPELFGHQLFHSSILQLLDLAHSPTAARVHAMNILRALYKNSNLGSRIRPHVADGVKVALTGFCDVSWNVRNAATLLFSCLMTRIFGVNRSRSKDCHRKNRLTGRVFFQHYPSLHRFLLDTFKKCLHSSQGPTSSDTLTPILILFSRLLPSALEGTDSDCSLQDFVPLALECRSSPVWATRVLASRALVNLLHPQTSAPICLSSLLDSLNSQGPNLLHGSLLQIHAIMKEHGIALEDRSQLLQCLEDFHSEFPRKPLAVRVAYLDLLILCLSHNWVSCDVAWISTLLDHLKLHLQLDQPYSPLYSARAAEWLLVVWSLQQALPSNLPLLLAADIYEVQLAACNFLVQLLGGEGSDNEDVLCLGSAIQALSRMDNLHTLLTDSQDLAEAVVAILAKLQHVSPLLQSQVFQLMSHLPLSRPMPWPTTLPGEVMTLPLQKLSFLLDCLDQTNLEDNMNALLPLASAIVLENKLLDQDDLSQVRKWLSFLLDFAQSDQSVSSRMEVARLLQHHLDALRPFLTDYRSTTIWQCWLTLAVDDDPDIRNIVSSTISQLASRVADNGESKESLSDSIFSLLQHHLAPNHPGPFLSTLINWVVPGDTSDIDDEQPFDRGELNIYAEDLLISEQAAKYLHTVETDLVIPTPHFLLPTSSSTSSLATVLEHCRDQVADLARHLSSLNPWTSRDFEATILLLTQRCLLLRGFGWSLPSLALDYDWPLTPCLQNIISSLHCK